MEFVIGAASWALGKALASAKDSLAETWAASKGIGDNFDALEMELLHAQWILDNPHVKQTRSPQLTELLVKLRQVAYDADDVLDELEYYHIQDAVEGTQHTDIDDDGGGLLLHARSTANAIGKRLTCCSFPSADDDPRTRVLEEDPNPPANGRRFFSCGWTSRAQQRKHDVETQKLKFDRVDMSTKMKNIVDKLKPLCAKLTAILETELLGSANFKLEQLGTNPDLLGKTRPTTHGNAMNRATASAEIIEPSPKLSGRHRERKYIGDMITKGEFHANQLTVLPIVGPGGIGKTALVNHIYEEVKSYFEISIWICVSMSFKADRLAEEIVKKIPRVDGERVTASVQELIEKRLKAKRFLLVLDDVWTYEEDEWLNLLAPFGKVVGNGNIIIVTTRIPSVANMVMTVDFPIRLECLDEPDFMNFFKACVFGPHGESSWEAHPELHEVGYQIMKKLKGSPLAAKTTGRLLGNQLTMDHWISVLESREWEQTSGEHDIMPALKLSYDYLPFHLQQCFSYLAMFPEDYQFDCEELIFLWMGLDILNSHDENRRPEDIGQSYLIDLVCHGFLIKYENDYGYSYYVIHDLIHELAMKVQSKECIRIHSSNIMSTKIPPSVRHLSIIVDETDVKDRVSFNRFKIDLSTLDRRLKIQKLRTLMLFGEHHGSFARTFGDLFRNARALRTIFLHGASYSVEDILHNFSRLVHLRYLKIESLYKEGICIPALCRLYHLHMVDLHRWKGWFGSTRSVSNLGNLRHFLVPDDAMHSGIFQVGKLKSLQELRRFEVGKENKGFELSQLEQLLELGGSLAIGNLERAQTVKEASDAKLIHKNHLHKLTLEWDVGRLNKDPTHEANILEVMKPHLNLRDICIRGHGGTNSPKWLGENLAVKNLESLHLDNVSWTSFPPIGELWMVKEHGEEHLGCVPLPHNRFRNLRRLELNKLPTLQKWVESEPCHLFCHLEVLIITHCFELKELSFSHSICCQQQKEVKLNWFPRLRELNIKDCPKLLSFPPIPWTRAPCSAKIEGVGSGLEKLVCEEKYKSEYSLEVKMKDGLVSEFCNVLAFDNLTELKGLKMDTYPPLPHHHFQMLSSLRTLALYRGSSIVFPSVEGESHAKYLIPVECIIISQWDASAKELTWLLTYFPKLSELNISLCEKITGIAVVDKHATETPAPAYSDNKVDDNAEREQHQQQQEGTRREEEAEGLLLLPSQLQKLWIDHCPELSLCSSPVDPNREAGRTSAGQGLQSLRSLRWLEISYCPKFLSYLSSSSLCLPFPTSLEHLSLFGTVGTATPLPLSYLTSLTDLSIKESGDLRGVELWHLIAYGQLAKLSVSKTPNFFAANQPSVRELEFPSSFSKLQKLWTDDILDVLTVPICTLLSSSLTELTISEDKEAERFTKEQEEALQLLTSLSEIRFQECNKLWGLPRQLRGLANLKKLYIDGCAAIRSLHKDGLPGSLQELVIKDCPAIRSLHKDGLPGSLQKLVIKDCPAIRSLPKVDDFPSSLLVLDVQHGNSKRLRRQCSKLIGTIPIVRV